MEFEELNKEKLDDFYAHIQKEYNKEIKALQKNQKEIENKIASINITDDIEEDKKVQLSNEKSGLEEELEKCKNEIEEKDSEKKEKVAEIRKYGKKLESLEKELTSSKEYYETIKGEKETLLDEEGNLVSNDFGSKSRLATIYATEKDIKEKEEEIKNLKDEFFKKYSNEFVDFSYFDSIKEINDKIRILSKNEKYHDELEYYNKRLEALNKIKDNSKLYYSTKYSENIEDREDRLSNIKEDNLKLNEEYKKLEDDFNNKEVEVKKEDKIKEEKEEAINNESKEISNSEETLINDIENDSNIEIDTVSSDKLTSMYENKIESIDNELAEIYTRKEEIEEIFRDKGVNISLDDVEDYDMSILKEEYNEILERETELNDQKIEVEELNNDIEYVKKLEIEIGELKNKVEKAEKKIEELEKDIDSEEDENKKAQLIKEKKNLSINLGDYKSRLKSREDKKKEKFFELKSKLNIDEKKIEKNKNYNKQSKSNNLGGNFVYTSQPNYDEIVDLNLNKDEKNEEISEEVKETVKEETALTETNVGIIDLYIKADKTSDKAFFNENYKEFTDALKEAVAKNNLTKSQKENLAYGLKVKNEFISNALKDVNNSKLYNDVVKKIYGDNNLYELNDYTKLNDNSELEFNDSVFNGIYKFDEDKEGNVIAKINDIEKMDDKTLELLNKMIEKHEQRLNDGTIKKGDELDKEFDRLVLDPIKLQVVNSYNKELQKPFIFRKLSGIFNSKKLSKVDKLKDAIIESSKKLEVNNNDRLGLNQSVKSSEEISKEDIEKAVNVKEEPTRNENISNEER